MDYTEENKVAVTTKKVCDKITNIWNIFLKSGWDNYEL